uniref:ribosomal protein S4 n=1 Tax=Mesembryanthemum crystallinum TaxID=3544 RepID=UPI003002A9A5|nr:ribosomal protein S4 [Mesembryanthemum crystallinum]
MPALRFKTCRLLSGNVRKRELTIIQRRILRKLRKKKRNLKKRIYPRKNRNNYIKLQTTRKLPLFYGNLPITKMQRGRASYIPFLLNPETRLDVIPVRLHFCDTLPKARQPISHRKVCVNNGIVNMTHFQVSHGDLISLKENAPSERRRSIYIKLEKCIGKLLGNQKWRRHKTALFRLLKTKKGCRLLLKSYFLLGLRSSMLERTKRSEKVCLGSSFAEHNRLKRNLYHFKSLTFPKPKKRSRSLSLLFSKEKKDFYSSMSSSDLPTYGPLLYASSRRRKRIELPTHYSEVNHRIKKAVVSYGPKIDHIPHDIRLKDPNLPLRSGNGRGQNV